jgi:hypothetical protein
MAHTRSWNFPETIPSDSDKVGQADDEVRNLSDDIAERQREGGQDWGASTTTDGRHFAHSTGGTPGFKVYKSDKTTVGVNFSDTAMTADSTVSIVGPNVTTGGPDPGHTHRGTVGIRVSSGLVAGLIKTSIRNPKTTALTFVKCSLVVFTAPASAVLRISAEVYTGPVANTTNRGGATGTQVWLVDANKPQVAIGEFGASTTTFDNVTSLGAGSELVFTIDATGFTAAADLTIQMDFNG